MADQPCGKDSGVVQDEEIAGAHMVPDPGKRCVVNCAAVTREHQEPRLSSRGRRVLSDELARQVEIKVARSH